MINMKLIIYYFFCSEFRRFICICYEIKCYDLRRDLASISRRLKILGDYMHSSHEGQSKQAVETAKVQICWYS